MKSLSSRAPTRLLSVALLATLFCTLSPQLGRAQQGSSPQAVLGPRPLITQAIDESQLAVLKGNTHPLARPQFDLGTAPATLPMQRMLLVLKRSPQQEYALRQLLDNQQAKSSPSYHKWLTPEQFGQQFGPTDSDMQTITAWLQSHGFQVGTTKGRTVLEFSGSASQVQEAFHTTIHKYAVNEEQHWANSSDPSIPAALTPAVAGVLTLHNFLKKPHIHFQQQPVTAKIVKQGNRPQVTFPAQNGQPTTYALGPADFGTIYSSPAYDSGITGAGITIGVIGRSNLYDGGEDVGDFRDDAFGIVGGIFNIVLNGPDPGDLGGDEEAEATLDSTWSGAVAPGANVELVVSATTNTTDGIDLSELYIVENNFANVMTESFGTCEYYSTDSQIAGTSALAEQAAAQGISYFVSAGDDGAEGCDDQDSETLASGPLSVNVLASTPFTTAVGGTQFNENGDDTRYWTNSQPISESAISYIPEDVWNASCLASACGSSAGIWAGSGGISSGNIGGGGTTPGFLKPSWQSGVTGIPADGVRDVPDVALTSASHDPYLLCLDGSCQPNSQGEIYIYFVWGTSAAAPSFAGITALVDQQMANLSPTADSRQGQVNYVLYRLAASQNSNLSQCNGSNATTLPASTCIFNDVTVGNNAVPGEINYGSSTADYQAEAGYDMTTGLGSVNITNLVNQWNSATFNPTITTLSFSPSSIVHGSSVNVTMKVAPSSGTGTPTGDVALLTGQGAGTGVGFFTLAGGSISSTTNALLGGLYFLQAQYGGDSTFAPSISNESSYITVTPEPSTTAVSVLGFDSNGNQFNFTSGSFGSFVYLRADVAGKSGYGLPTGSVTFADTFGTIPGIGTLTLNSQGNTATPNGVTFDTGTHTISASYSGDASFNASSSTVPQTFTITPGFFASVPSNQSSVSISAPGSSGSTSVSVSSSTGFTGTISLSCSGLPTGAACNFSPSTITAPGTLATGSSAITVTTAAATTALRSPRQPHPHLAHWLAAGGFMLFSIVLVGARRRVPLQLLLVLLALLMFVPACGGGGGGSSTPPPATNPGTPAGTYNVTVTATSGSASSATGFTLVLQ